MNEYLTVEEKRKKKMKVVGLVIAVVAIFGLGGYGVVQLAKNSPSVTVPGLDEVRADEHILGNKDAKIKLVEYSDFQCPACASFSPKVAKLHEDFGDQLLIIYRHYPLPSHRNSQTTAFASEAASNQGKFWEMAKILFDRQPDWASATDPLPIFLTYAQELGLDKEKFINDYSSGETKAKVTSDARSGDDANVNYTPTFYLNGQKITNPATYEQFYDLIKNAQNK